MCEDGYAWFVDFWWIGTGLAKGDLMVPMGELRKKEQPGMKAKRPRARVKESEKGPIAFSA